MSFLICYLVFPLYTELQHFPFNMFELHIGAFGKSLPWLLQPR